MAILTAPDLLQRVPLFKNLSHLHATSLTGALRKCQFKRSELLVEAGKKSNTLFIILSGTVRVVISNDKGREVVLATLAVGDCIGEMSLLDSQPHSASVIANTPVDALALSQEAFNSCILHNAALTVSIMQGLVGRLRNANQKIASMALVSVSGRVAHYLMELGEPDPEGGLIIKKKLSHVGIARQIGASREMVGRTLKEFEEQGFYQKLDNGMLRIAKADHALAAERFGPALVAAMENEPLG
jgi:CRP/FNR family transcriptional regulator, cyclic AMP receptor protein